MKKILAILLFFIPHPFNRLLRRLAGQKVAFNSRIHLFSFICCENLKVGERTIISPFTFMKAKQIHFGHDVHIAPLTIINAPIMDGANISVGHFSRIFPFCWLEPGEGITIGEQVGIGGHTLIFTHGVWSNFLSGGPVTFGPVVIEDNVWLPWRVFIMPNVIIGKNSIIGANSTVTKNIPPFSLAAGSPAKVIKENINSGLTSEGFDQRCEEILKSYTQYCARTGKKYLLSSGDVKFTDKDFKWGSGNKIQVDLNQSVYKEFNNFNSEHFISFLRRYGIRVSPCP